MADQGCVWLVGRRSVCGRRLSLRPVGCTPALCDMNSADAAAVCGLRCYPSVIIIIILSLLLLLLLLQKY